MKTLFLAIAAALTTLHTAAQESDTLSRSVFKLSPQHFLANSLKAGLERFNPGHTGSFVIFLTGMMENKEEVLYYDDWYDGLAAEFQLRKYVSPMKSHISKRGKSYFSGVYGAAYVQAGYYSGEFKGENSTYDPVTGNYNRVSYEYEEKILNGGFGFIFGYQKTLWQVVFLEGFVGGGIQFAERNAIGVLGNGGQYYDGVSSDPYYRGILPKIGLNVGIGL